MKEIKKFEEDFTNNFFDLFYDTFKIRFLTNFERKYYLDSLIRCKELFNKKLEDKIKKAK